jgi:hypothetical protein
MPGEAQRIVVGVPRLKRSEKGGGGSERAHLSGF